MRSAFSRKRRCLFGRNKIRSMSVGLLLPSPGGVTHGAPSSFVCPAKHNGWMESIEPEPRGWLIKTWLYCIEKGAGIQKQVEKWSTVLVPKSVVFSDGLEMWSSKQHLAKGMSRDPIPSVTSAWPSANVFWKTDCFSSSLVLTIKSQCSLCYSFTGRYRHRPYSTMLGAPTLGERNV